MSPSDMLEMAAKDAAGSGGPALAVVWRRDGSFGIMHVGLSPEQLAHASVMIGQAAVFHSGLAVGVAAKKPPAA